MKGRGRAPSARERRKRRRSGSITNGTQEVREQIEDDQKSNRTLALQDVGSSQAFFCDLGWSQGCQSTRNVSLSSPIKKQGGANFPCNIVCCNSATICLQSGYSSMFNNIDNILSNNICDIFCCKCSIYTLL